MKLLLSALFFLGVATAVTTGHSFVGSKLNDQLVQLKTIDADLCTTVQSMIEAGDPVDDIIALLNDLRADIEADQQRASDQHNQKKDYCSSEESKLRSDISHLEREINSAEAEVAQLRSEAEATEGLLQENEKLLEENGNEQQRAHSSREDEVEEYKKTTTDHQDAIDAIDEVLRLLDESTLTDIQIFQDKVPSFLQKIAPHAKSTSMKSKIALIESLVKTQSSLRGDQQPADRSEKVDTIIRLLNELREQFVNSLAVLERNNQANQRTFEALINALEKEAENIREKIDQLSGEISRLNNEANEKERETSSLSQERDILENEVIPALIADCESHANQYEEQNRSYIKELDVIDQCIEILGGRVQPRLPGICPNCGENAHCENDLCVCNVGYKGNGFDCEKKYGEPVAQLAISTLSSSSIWRNDHAEACANFDTPSFCYSGAWCAKDNQAGEWFQIDMHEVKLVSKIKIGNRFGGSGGHYRDYQRVTSVSVRYSNDGQNWQEYGVFNNNNEVYELETNFEARYVRLVALKWNQHISMRVEVYASEAY